MLNDDSSPASPPAEASPRPKKYRLVRRLLGLLTFVDLPIKRKFLLLTAGTLFWFASMAVVTVLALTAIAAFRPRRWHGAILPKAATVRFDVLEPAKRPVMADADSRGVDSVHWVEIRSEPAIEHRILFDAGHGLEERLTREQFV